MDYFTPTHAADILGWWAIHGGRPHEGFRPRSGDSVGSAGSVGFVDSVDSDPVDSVDSGDSDSESGNS